MRLKLSYGNQELFSDYPETGKVTVKQVLESVKSSHPDIYKRLCDGQGRLRDSLPVFVNGEHIRYREGIATELKEGDELYIVPFITGG